MDCFAEPVIGRAFARPGGSQWRDGALPDGQISKSCPAHLQKIFRFPRRANQRYQLARLAPTGGAYRDRHGRRARDAVDALARARRTAPMRTAKSCGPDAPMLASSSWEA